MSPNRVKNTRCLPRVRGELYDFLKKLGRPMTDCGSTSPLRHLIENRLISPECIVAHLNELDDRDLELLSRTEWRNLQIVHCPKSHRFLHHKRFPLEALMKRGLNICLGTDSLASNDSLDLFSEMRTAKKNLSDTQRAETWLKWLPSGRRAP